MLNQLLETIIQILTGWLNKFDSHAQHVEDKLDSLDQTASDIETNTEPISDIADNTGAVITPVQNIKSNTDSIKQSSQTSANNTTAILNNVSTLSTNTGRAAAFAEDCANNTLDIKDKVTTIASDTTQLRADTSELNDMSDKIYEAIKWGLADKYIDETESGPSPMSFDTDIADDLKSLNIGIIGSQPGTGVPSPSNVRPITGYSSMSLTVNGSSVSIALGDTYYSGFLDVISGLLTIDKKLVTIDGSTVYGELSGSNMAIRPNNLVMSYALVGDIYKLWKSNMFSITSAGSTIGYNTTSHFMFIRESSWKSTGATDAATFNTFCGSNNIQFLYPLDVPVTVSLTAQQIAAINGVNVITSDTNGNIEVTYKESIKHYLDKQDN